MVPAGWSCMMYTFDKLNGMPDTLDHIASASYV